MRYKYIVATLCGVLIAAAFGALGGVAQTSLLRTQPGAVGALAFTDNVNGASGFYFGPTFVSVGGSSGHMATQQTTPPSFGSCGTSPVLDAGSTDFAGSFTTGSAATSCILNFGTNYVNAPACSIDANGNATQPTFTIANNQINMSVDIASTRYSYICIAKTGG